MRGTRVKQLRKALFKEWPFLKQKFGNKLLPYNIVFRRIKEGYKDHFSRFGFEGARTKCKT